MNELEIIFLFGIYFSIGSIRIIHNFLNFERWQKFERESESESRLNDLIFDNTVLKQDLNVIEEYIKVPLQRKYSKRDFAVWGFEILIAGPLNLLALPNRW